MAADLRLAAPGLTALVRAVCARAGSSDEEAGHVAAHLVEANLMGHDSHGIGMLPHYIAAIRAGTLKVNQHPTVLLDSGALALYDGHYGFGHAIAHEFMVDAIARAKTHGVAVVALKNARHIGRVGAWGEQAAAAGLIAINYVSGAVAKPVVAPHGGADGRFQTTPVCIAVPIAGQPPFVLDFATSRIAMGKVRVARNQGKALPPGCIIDADGEPSTDPNVMYDAPKGALLPAGEHKGSGLALACELLAGALTNGRMVHRDAPDGDITNNMLTILIDPDRLGASAYFATEAAAIVEWVKSARPAAGVDEVLVAGEPERLRREGRLADGIPVDPATWAEVVAAAASVGLTKAEIDRIIA